MRARPGVVDAGVVFARARVVAHVAQVVVGRVIVTVLGGEEVFGKLEDEGKELEDLLSYFEGFLRGKG